MSKVYPFDIPPGKKYCYRCKSVLDLQDFGSNRARKDEHCDQCKSCAHAYKSQPHVRERDRKHARAQWKRITQTPEGREEYNQRKMEDYYAHRDARRDARAAAYANNPEKHREIARGNYQKNKHRWVNACAKRKMLKYDGDVTKEELQAICERDTICYICNKSIGEYSTQFDHIIPLSRGGKHTASNIRLTHTICNKRKKARLLEEMTEFQRRGV